jgi:S-adenosylmethionine hydrolase
MGALTRAGKERPLQLHSQALCACPTHATARCAKAAPRQGAAFWYENSNGLAEISVNLGSASRELGVAVGTAIKIVS